MTFLELEKECKKLKMKKFLFWIVFIFLILVICLFFYNFINKNKTVPVKEIKSTNHMKNIHKNKNLKEVNFTKNINNQLLIKKEVNISIKQSDKKIKTTEVLKPIIDLNISGIANKEIIKNVKEKKSLKNKIVKEDFNESNNYNKPEILDVSTLPSFKTCIKLAEKYFKKHDFKNAVKWAKNANLQNKEDPRSWIIVALSLYKLGKKDKAIQILKIYYNFTKSKEILKLIERMKSGKI